MKNTRFVVRLSAVLAAISLGLSACAWITPNDPYLQAKSVPALKVPDSFDSPSPDPNLIVPDGEIAEKPVKGGHMPPTDPIIKPSE